MLYIPLRPHLPRRFMPFLPSPAPPLAPPTFSTSTTFSPKPSRIFASRPTYSGQCLTHTWTQKQVKPKALDHIHIAQRRHHDGGLAVLLLLLVLELNVRPCDHKQSVRKCVQLTSQLGDCWCIYLGSGHGARSCARRSPSRSARGAVRCATALSSEAGPWTKAPRGQRKETTGR